ncbi:ATP-binding protein [Streptomyces sp. NPDC019539]|uniref:ATP-binding protein n=1 Tax=Streptomyces sp. NPDC019539 TaxID=3365063 RepID=UPI003796F202
MPPSQPSFPVPDPIQLLSQPAALSLAEAMPSLLVSLLERRHLTDFQPSRWEVSAVPDDSGRPLLREVLGMGRPQPGEDPGSAMTQVLTAGHWAGQATVAVVHGDGARHRVYLGGRRIAGAARGSTQDFLEGQASALQAHFPGLRLGDPSPLDGAGIPCLSGFLRSAPALALVTGIPSPRAGSSARGLQSLDRLTTAVGERRYALVVVAEPLDPTALDEVLDRTRRLKSEVHALVHRTISQTVGESSSVSKSSAEETDWRTTLPVYLSALAAFCSAAGTIPGLHGYASAAGAVTGLGRLAPVALGTGFPTSTQTGSSETLSRGGTVQLLDANAQACEELLQRHIDRIRTARSHGWWRTSVYVAADGDGTLEAVTSALRGICSGEDTALDPMRVVRLDPWTIRSAVVRGQSLRLAPAAGQQGHPLGESFDSLGTCVTSPELAVLVSLPRREIPGLPMRDIGEFALSAPPETDASVPVGTLLGPLGRGLGPVTVTAEALNRHVFITGMTGYGKTTTAKNLLVEAYSRLDVPFLVIEPVKAEYRALAAHPALHGRLRVYSIGADSATLPLRLNPFVPIESVPLARHIDLLKAVFNASFPMFAGMSYVLEEAMLEIYAERGWNLHSSANDLLGPGPTAEDLSALTPSIGDLHSKIEEVLERRRYGREVHQNMGAALRSRLGSLMVGSKGMAMDTRRSVPAHELFRQPCVIELRNLGDDEEKAFVMALLLCLLYEYAESRQPASGAAAPTTLQHLTLIEEAHRLLRAARPPAGPETPDAQAKAVTMFTDMLAEMRAYGEGFIVADQIPTKLAPETLKNSNVKILHRLVAQDDRTAVAATVNLTEDQSRHIAALSPGEAVVHDDRIGSPVLVQMTAPAPATAAAPSARPVDLSYLHRNAGCRDCPAPCSFLHVTGGGLTGPTPADAALAPFFRSVLLAGPEDAWRAWETWRADWTATAGQRATSRQMLSGLLYCTVSQAGHRWLQSFCALVTGPERLLGIDRAARWIGRLGAEWTDARELDRTARQQVSEAQAALRTLVAVRPRRELSGCADCPARCLMEPFVAQHLPGLAAATAARAGASTSVPVRVRSLKRLASEQAQETWSSLPPDSRDAFLYCLVTHTTVDEPALDLLSSLRGDAEAGTSPPHGLARDRA